MSKFKDFPPRKPRHEKPKTYKDYKEAAIASGQYKEYDFDTIYKEGKYIIRSCYKHA